MILAWKSKTASAARATICLLLAMAIAPASPVSAQEHHRHGGGGNNGGAEAFPAQAALNAQQARLETELATMLEQRAQGPSPVLEFQIDMHILARWLTQQSAGAAPRSDMQTCAYLRCIEILNCGSMLSAKLAAAPITAIQADGLARLHKLTFKLPEVKEIGKLDEVCKTIAIDLIAANGPLPAGMHDLPPMRPQPIAPPLPVRLTPPAQPRTLKQLVDDANHASVSPALHAQLVTFAGAAAAAANDPSSGDEAATLSTMLGQVMDLVTGLQTNVGVDGDQRATMEQQLTDGVALFADPRMRTAGRQRIESLDHYRQNLDRIRKLHLSDELSTKLSPAFVYAQQNPDTGNDVMDDIQKWLAITGSFDHHTSPPGLSSNQSHIVDAMQKQYALHRDGFVTDAGNLSSRPGATFSASSGDLSDHLAKMQDAINTIQLVERADVATNALLAFHPRPTGGMEHRVSVSLAAIAENINSSSHLTQRQIDRQNDAMQFLTNLERLAQAAAEVSTGSNGIPDAVTQAWAGGKLAAFDSKRADLVAALASQAASNRTVDAATLDRLDQAKILIAALHDAAAAQSALDQIQPLSHWVDWNIAPADLQTVLSPLRDATSAAFAGFINDQSDALHQWATVRDQYAPLINLVSAAGMYADQCSKMPGDLVGEMAKLATPMNDAPFSDERLASECMGLWSSYTQASDAASADAMVQALLKIGK